MLISKQLGFGDGHRTKISIDFIAEVRFLPLAAVYPEFILFRALGDNGDGEAAGHLLERGYLYGGVLIDINITQEHVTIVLHIQSQRVDSISITLDDLSL